MYCSSGSSMATLLQQKNCMKTLTNGSVAGGTSTAGQQSRVLLPHEMVTIPTTPMSTSTSVVAGASMATPIATQHHQPHQNQATIHQQQSQYNNYGYYNNIHSNDAATSSMYRQSSTLTTTTTNSQMHHPHLQHHHPHQNSNHAQPTTSSATSLLTSSSAISSVPFAQPTIMTADSTTVAGTNCPITADTINGIDRIIGSTDGIGTTSPPANNEQQMDDDQEPEPEIDIVINNVVCSFSVRCHLNLREIALNGINVEFRRENGMVTMKLRRPYTTASIWSSGRITCTGATSEYQAKIAARRYARCLQKLGFSVKFNNFRVVNVLGTCSMPWAIKIVNFSEKYKQDASYEPELHPGVTYKLKFPKATLKIFSTGSITVTASSVANVQAAIEHIFPLVYEFRKKRAQDDPKLLKEKAALEAANLKRKNPFGHASNDPAQDMMYVSEPEDFDEETNDL